ncbi:hypothetical protein PQX77_022403 [Marasmius sp. AFHP31]|nr:hypothetical protein PQX77_022403 [Marasmius sp. AFHP31]
MASTSTTNRLPPIPKEIPPMPLYGPTVITLYQPEPDSIVPAACDNETFRPFYKNRGDEEIRKRRTDALRYVSDLLEDKPDSERLRQAKRRIFSEFPQQTNLLASALGNILQGKKKICWEEQGKKMKDDIEVFSLQPRIFKKLMFSLFKVQGLAQDSFILRGKKTLKAPAWLRMGGNVGEEFLNSNDFELLGTTFRAQVESYLTELSEYHDFATGLPAGFDELDKDYAASAALVLGKKEKRKDKKRDSGQYDSISVELQAQRAKQYGKRGHHTKQKHSDRHSDKKADNSNGSSHSHYSQKQGRSHIKQNERLRNLYKNGDSMSSSTETDNKTETEKEP